MKAYSRALTTSDWVEGSPSNGKTTLSTQPRQCRSGFGTSLFVWPSQSLDLNPIEQLWRDLKMSVQQCSPSNLTDLERNCREEWEKLPKYRCAKLVASFPRRLEVLITTKGASTMYWIKGLNTYVNIKFPSLFFLQKCLKPCFYFVGMAFCV